MKDDDPSKRGVGSEYCVSGLISVSSVAIFDCDVCNDDVSRVQVDGLE